MSSPSGGSGPILERLLGLGVRLDLGPFRALLGALGDPQEAAPALLVAGTNGKGSVAVLVDFALRAAGYETVLATSPHLVRPHERIRLDGAEIGEPALASILERVVRAAPAATPPTYFEALVAAAFLAGAEAGVDAFVLEVGLGGRLDATNACEPAVSVVTRVALDHRAELGSSLAAIAIEKAGVFRRDRVAVVAAQSADAAAALTAAAHAVGARERKVSATVRTRRHRSRGLGGHELKLETALDRYHFELALAGDHQVDNAHAALAACEELARAALPRLQTSAIERGFSAARWPGRLESIAVRGTAITLLLDAAHNPDGCAALARFLAALGRPHLLLFGALADKEARAMLAQLAPAATAIVLTRPESPRALDPRELARECGPGAIVECDPHAAADCALELARNRGVDLVVAGGSIYLIGPLREHFASG